MQGQSEHKKGLPAHTSQQGMLYGVNQVLREAPPEGRLYRHRTTKEENRKVSTVVKGRDRSYGDGSWQMEDEYAMGLKCSYMPVKKPYLIDDASRSVEK